MNPVITSILCGLIGYVMGSIPFGFMIVRAAKGLDVRTQGSGRTGGTNVYRTAGLPAALLTAFFDIAKGLVPVLILRSINTGTNGWAEVLAGLGAVLGHNYSMFLGFKGGAGGATAVGTGFGFALISGVLSLIIGCFFLFIVGYASLATISAALTVAITLTVMALNGTVPSIYPLYGWGILIICLIALRPNIERLLKGNERRVDILNLRGKK